MAMNIPTEPPRRRTVLRFLATRSEVHLLRTGAAALGLTVSGLVRTAGLAAARVALGGLGASEGGDKEVRSERRD